MGSDGEHGLPELNGKIKADFSALLDRARDAGILSKLNATRFPIHPALSSFLPRTFEQHFDGQRGHSTSRVALRAWAEAVGKLGGYYQFRYTEGDLGALRSLEMEEANLLHARRLSRRNEWRDPVISCMQSLCVLYEYQGRMSEWARLVEESRPDHCSTEDRPIPGREYEYDLIIAYRINLAKDYERDLAKAIGLQETWVASERQQAEAALALRETAKLDDKQRSRLQALGVSVHSLGQILFEQGDAACLGPYQESLEIAR
jgi:hypothetical protein